LKTNIAFIGTVGVPNVYGGFEMFLEVCGPRFAEHFNAVFITCDKSRYSERTSIWRGVHRVFIPVRANGAQSIFHDLLAFFAVFWRVKAIYHLVAAGETNWFDYARHVIAQARQLQPAIQIKATEILPVPTSAFPTPARRPHNSRMNTSKVQRTFGLTLPHWQVGVNRMLEEIL
jgi:hypothetical protein